MKKIFFYLVLTLFVGQISAQNRMVQGIERPDLQNKSTRAAYSLRTNTSFTLDDIDFWTGDGENRAALVISWHDTVTGLTDDLVWGYRWPDGTTARGYDMIKAVAEKDPRFLLLTQFTSPSAADTLGYTIDGIGYSSLNRDSVKLKYILGQKDPFILGASTDSRISFKFDTPNTMMGQDSCPTTPQADADNAIVLGQQNGVIEHPFNSKKYGYACYDYDYWQVDSSKYASTPDVYWRAGWYNGYWSYFVRSNNTQDFGYSGDGASRRQLSDGSWDAWSYNADMNNWEGTQPGEVFTAAPAVVKVDIKSATLNPFDDLSLVLTIDTTYISGGTVTWSSANNDVATVNNNGVITAEGAGKTYIKATINGYSAFCDITVVETRSAASATTGKILYTDNSLRIKDLSGYTAYISRISGSIVSTFRITSADEVKSLNLTPGIYNVTAIKGTEKVSTKFIVK